MNDQDYIRNAVELADGWRLGDIAVSVNPADQDDLSAWWIDEMPQYALDALAAQLVRQVDAMDRYGVYTYPGGATIMDEQLNVHEAKVDGSERTMNTIKAIVDSGVLNND